MATTSKGDLVVGTEGEAESPTAEDAPITEDEDAPITEAEDAPITEDEDAPTAEDEDAPTAEDEDAPTAEDEDAPIAEDEEMDEEMDDGGTRYEKMTLHEHILARPDSYVGSIQPIAASGMLVAQRLNNSADITIERRDVPVYTGALYKIIDEVIVNAIDHFSNTRTARGASRMRCLDITVDRESGEVSVYNDGRGIPVKKLKEHGGMYAPELIFGNLLTSSNYRDEDERVTGGRNGYGAKCTNIYSKRFVVDTCDSKRVYQQTWAGNMLSKCEPVVRKVVPGDVPHTRVSFVPDFARLGVPGFDEDMIGLLRRRAADMAAWGRGQLAVTFNGKPIGISSLETYARAYVGPERAILTHRSKDGRWEFVVTHGTSGTFEHISFVNGIATRRGGRHVDHVIKPIAKALAATITKRRKIRVTQSAVRSQVLLFVRAIVTNPAFDGQVKEQLTTPASKFGSALVLPSSIADRIIRDVPLLADHAVAHAEYRGSRALKKTDGVKKASVRGIPKLCDANLAGGRRARDCTLILTEGDSAKTMAISGMAVIPRGRDVYGAFPLRGKLPNVKGLATARVAANAEITALKAILGLKTGAVYSATDKPWRLRYGRILIMTDQDVDGSHIKGLLANIFHTHWPSLLHIGFLHALITPIVKVRSRRKKKEDPLVFYNLKDYDSWCESTPEHSKTHSVKYYKGLGTSDSKEAKEYFSTQRREVAYTWDPARCDTAIDLAFNKARADDRKKWLTSYDPAAVLDAHRKSVSFADFVDNELKHFSHYDVHRSIPSAIDGLKPSQRKVLFACFKRRLTREIKVAQLAGYVSEHAAYHHGEVSLQGTIVGMAQNYVGSNNVHLLKPCGQFGSRLMGGADAASPRYIFTKFTPLAPLLFPEADMPLLDSLEDDGVKIEPTHYVPVIPTVLCNGARGIGTGWSTDVPPHDPREVAANVLRWIENDALVPLRPWYRGFTGVVEKVDRKPGTFLTRGRCRIEGNRHVRVLELPVGVWNLAYTAFLEKEIARGRIGLLDYQDCSTDTAVNFLLTFDEQKLASLQRDGDDPERFQKTIGVVARKRSSYKNMYLFDRNNQIRRFVSAEDILSEFCEARRELYVKRHAYELSTLEARRDLSDEKKRFVEAVVAGTLELRGKPTVVLEDELEALGFDPRKGHAPFAGSGRFKHLLSMPLSVLTKERVEHLRKEYASAVAAHTHLLTLTPTDIWKGELRAFQDAYKKDLEAHMKARKIDEPPKKKRSKRRRKKKNR